MRAADLPIADYALIGNQRTAALVARDGAVDWFCWPRFDSAAVLCRLLDREQGGFFQVAPRHVRSTRRKYVTDTNVLEIEFETPSGMARGHYFMPLSLSDHEEHSAHWLAVRIECVAGEVDLEVLFRPTFDYARAPTRVDIGEGGAVASAGEQSIVLVTSASLRPMSAGGVRGTLLLHRGESTWAVLSSGTGASSGPVAIAPGALDSALERTVVGWREWTERCTYEGPFSELVRRSALVLKLLTYAPTGGVVAAPTTSLPEEPGGVRNWDYRFTWLRDSALILYALQRLGYHDEAMAFWKWLEELPRVNGEVQIMYAVDGAPDLPESQLDHLSGYRDSRPVRIGNGAYQQRQSDVYGEVLDSAEFCQREMQWMVDDGFWRLVCRLATRAEEVWQSPDRGIWEIRGPSRHFVHSKVMCWLALDRAARIAERTGNHQKCAEWREGAERIRRDVLEKGVDPHSGAFVQAYGSTELDASTLLLPIVGFVPATDPRVVATVRRIQSELTHDGLVFRYRAKDGLPGGEGTFVLCTLWLVDVLALQGHASEARSLLERVVRGANDLGLMSEELNAASGELLGNFPQGFSHLGLIRAALLLRESEQRGECRAAREQT